MVLIDGFEGSIERVERVETDLAVINRRGLFGQAIVARCG